MPWLDLTIAGFFEVFWAVCLKYAQGFTRLGPSVASVAGMVLSVWFLSRALRVIPVGTGYAVWTGIGAVGTAVAGAILFGESRHPLRLISIGVILAGILGLKFLSKE